jgi:hypothetical protein
MAPVSRRQLKAIATLAAVVAAPVLSCVVCRPLVNSIWYQMSCGGFGLLGDRFVTESLGIEYRAPRRAFPIEDLLIEESVFPDAWHAHEPFDPKDGVPAEQIAFTLFPDGSRCPSSFVTGYQVYRFYGGERCAEAGYRRKTAVWFAPWPGCGSWTVPGDLAHESAPIDRFRVECCTGQETRVQTCQAVARYEEFVIRFHTSIDADHPECMSFADLARILVAIDERMALYLGQDTQ